MLVEAPACDWLTLSEKLLPGTPSVLYGLTKQIGTPGRESRRIGYLGKVYEFFSIRVPHERGAFFYGERAWKGADWALLVASGESAHFLLQHIWATDELQWLSIRCTRIDVQVTVRWPEYPLFLRHLARKDSVKATTVHGLSEGDEWEQTLYLGSRSSPVLVRAYRKRVDDTRHDWLRVEVEYKRQASQDLFFDIVADKRVANWFAPVLERCSALYELIEGHLDDSPDKPTIHRIEGNTFKWLSSVVANCVCRLLADDDHHEQMSELVAQWFEYSRACQRRKSGL